MPTANPSDDHIRQLLLATRTIAVVGASGNPGKPSYDIMQRLQRLGYKVVPVNPHETAILGELCAPSLTAVPERIDIVDVFRRPDDTPPIADEAAAIGAKALWLQKGITSEEAALRASRGGLVVIMDRCIADTAERLSQKPRR